MLINYKLQSGYSYGYGFVNFVLEEDAVTAQEEMNGFEVENKKIKVSFARPPSDDIKDTNLYITNLPRKVLFRHLKYIYIKNIHIQESFGITGEMSEDEVVEIFRPYGSIIQKKLLRDKYTNLPRGVAFIRYEKREQAARAIIELNNYVPKNHSEPISIRLAQDHGKQRSVYLAGFQAGLVVPRSRPQSDSYGKWRQERSSRSRSHSLYSRR